MRLRLASLVTALVLAGCASTPANCVEGEYHVCPCADGTQGRQLCHANSYGDCNDCAIDAGHIADAATDTAADAGRVPQIGEPCTPPGAGTPSRGVCNGDGRPLDCVSDGTYQLTDTCGANEACAVIDASVMGLPTTWAVCAPSPLVTCSPTDVQSCIDSHTRNDCSSPLLDQNAFWSTPYLLSTEAYVLTQRACASDEVCDQGQCFIDTTPCTADAFVCEGTNVRICTMGLRPTRQMCGGGSACVSAAACASGGAFCAPIGATQCASGEPARSCTADGLGIRICSSGGSVCWGQTECLCAPIDESCGDGNVCHDPGGGLDPTCIPDVDCSHGSFCDGDAAITCDGTTPQSRFDCAHYGMTCASAAGQVGCTLGTTCTGASTACNAGIITGCCDSTGSLQTGQQVLPCISGQRVTYDCNASGAPVTYTCMDGRCFSNG